MTEIVDAMASVQVFNGPMPNNESDLLVIMMTLPSYVAASGDGDRNNAAAVNVDLVAMVTAVAKAIVMLAIICATLMGNTLVIVGVYKSDKLRSSIANVFIVSLAAADFMVALLVMPFSAIQVSQSLSPYTGNSMMKTPDLTIVLTSL
jgi:hypothetical protein